MKTLRERLQHILEITEHQPDENTLIILKTLIAEYEGQFKDKTPQNHHWRNLSLKSFTKPEE